MKYFWTNTIWYILLALSTILELIFIFTKVKKRKFTLAFYLTTTGITLSIESILIFIIRAYHYYPKIILTSYFDDELSGNLVSQFSISATALIVAVLNLKYNWIILFAVVYGIIEELFLLLGIYSHAFYSTWVTVLGLAIFFALIKKLYLETLKGSNPILHYVNIVLGLFTGDTITILWGFILSGYQNYSKNFGNNPLVSPYLLAIFYYLFIAAPLITVYFLRLRTLTKGLVILGLYVSTYAAGLLKIMYFKNDWWFLIFSTVFIFSVYYSIVFLDYLYKNK